MWGPPSPPLPPPPPPLPLPLPLSPVPLSPPPPPSPPLHDGYCAALQSLADSAHAVPVQLARPGTQRAPPEDAVPPQYV